MFLISFILRNSSSLCLPCKCHSFPSSPVNSCQKTFCFGYVANFSYYISHLLYFLSLTNLFTSAFLSLFIPFHVPHLFCHISLAASCRSGIPNLDVYCIIICSIKVKFGIAAFWDTGFSHVPRGKENVAGLTHWVVIEA